LEVRLTIPVVDRPPVTVEGVTLTSERLGGMIVNFAFSLLDPSVPVMVATV
jgi:hypothetical protein